MEDFEGRLLLNQRLCHLWYELGPTDRKESMVARYRDQVEPRAGDYSVDRDRPISRARNRPTAVHEGK